MDGIEWAASAMVAARTRLDVATENLANVSTAGYRRIDARGFLTATGVGIEQRRESAPSARVGSFTLGGVDTIGEMVDVLAAERSFESAQKVVSAIDGTRRTSSDAAALK
jgi:flagellar basal body rod protein FlgG